MGQLRDRMEAARRKIYLGYARLFAKHHMCLPAEMGGEEIWQYLLHMVEEKKTEQIGREK